MRKRAKQIKHLLSIENEEVLTLREILSNLHLEEQSFLQNKPSHREEILKDRISLRKKARKLRLDKNQLLSTIFHCMEVTQEEFGLDDLIHHFEIIALDAALELRNLEDQRIILIEKTLSKLKHNREIRLQSLIALPKLIEPEEKKKPLLLQKDQHNISS